MSIEAKIANVILNLLTVAWWLGLAVKAVRRRRVDPEFPRFIMPVCCGAALMFGLCAALYLVS